MEHLLELLWHTLLDTLKLVPFLFLSYLLMEFLEHRSGNAAERLLRRSGKVGPLLGGALGIVPQCGFSAAASGLYCGRVITTGTLLAVYLSTSDEMLPIMISRGAPAGEILKILGIKLVIAVAVGFLVDAVTRLYRSKHVMEETEPQIEALCERERCDCHDHFALSALKHTLSVTLFIFAVTLVLELGIHWIGEERLASVILDRPVIGNLLASLVGLIPNCASSVVLTELYLGGFLSLGCLLSGLLVNAGIGIAVLFRGNRPLHDSFRVVGILWLVGVLAGILIDGLFLFS